MWRGSTRPEQFPNKLKNWEIKRNVGVFCHQTPSCKPLFLDAPPGPSLAGALALNDNASPNVFPRCSNASLPSHVAAAWPDLSIAERECAFPQLLYLDAEFCLTPPGDTQTRKSLFDALVMGCIPVWFDRLTAQYPWFWTDSSIERFAIVVSPEALSTRGGVLAVLEAVTEDQRKQLRANIRFLWPFLQYGYDESVDGSLDAVDVLLANVHNTSLQAVLS